MGSYPSIPKHDCSICLSSLDKDQKTLECGHSFHEPCVATWFQHKKSCPICRRDFEPEPELPPNQDYATLRVSWVQEGEVWSRIIVVTSPPLSWRPSDGPMPASLQSWIAGHQ
jgi:hypothetical protein